MDPFDPRRSCVVRRPPDGVPLWPLHARVALLRRREAASFAHRDALATTLAALGQTERTTEWYEPPPECRDITTNYAAALGQWGAILAGPWLAQQHQEATSRVEVEAAFDAMELLLEEAPWEVWLDINWRMLLKIMRKRWEGGAIAPWLPTLHDPETVRAALPWLARLLTSPDAARWFAPPLDTNRLCPFFDAQGGSRQFTSAND